MEDATEVELNETDEKSVTMEVVWDWYSTTQYQRWFKKKPNPKEIIWANSEWGVKLLHDGSFREGVPQMREAKKSGRDTSDFTSPLSNI